MPKEKDYPNIVKSYSKKYDMDVKELDKIWVKAREHVEKKYKLSEDDDEYYPIVTNKFKKILREEHDMSLESNILEDINYILETNNKERTLHNLGTGLLGAIFTVGGGKLILRQIEKIQNSNISGEEISGGDHGNVALLILGFILAGIGVNRILTIFRRGKYNKDIQDFNNYIQSHPYMVQINDAFDEARSENKKCIRAKLDTQIKCMEKLNKDFEKNIKNSKEIPEEYKKEILNRYKLFQQDLKK